MPAPFAALEARVNRSVVGRLANAEMVFAGGTVAVVFGTREADVLPPSLGGGGHSSLREWIAGAPLVDFATVNPKRGDAVTVSGNAYTLAEVDTDATGWQTWTLRPA